MVRASIRQLMIGLIGLLLVGGGVIAKQSFDRRMVSQTPQEEFLDQEKGIKVQYPKSFLPRPVGEEERKVGYLLRADQVDPPAFFFLKFEVGGKGLGTVSALGGIARLEVLRRNSEKTLPNLYKNYHLEGVEEIKLARYDGFVFTFTYEGPSGQRIKQRLTEVLRDGSYIYSFISQSPAETFKAYLPTFRKIEASAEFLPLALKSPQASPNQQD